jgi:hypothetical protein
MPTFHIPGNDNSVKLASTHQEKAAALSAISLPHRDDEIRRITRYKEWCNLLEDSESEDEEAVSHGCNNEARGTIIVRPPLRAA